MKICEVDVEVDTYGDGWTYWIRNQKMHAETKKERIMKGNQPTSNMNFTNNYINKTIHKYKHFYGLEMKRACVSTKK